MSEAQFQSMSAAADYLGPGAIEINDYEREILDRIRRRSVLLDRVQPVSASGHPHRYFEQTGMAAADFTDPRSIAPTATTPTRVERSVMIKAIVNQTNFTLFDQDVTRQQGKFASVIAKDILDVAQSVHVKSGKAAWDGSDTSLSTPTTSQYMGLLRQITQTSTILSSASIIDGLKAQVAVMVANATFEVMPTAIYVNPILADKIDKEAKATQFNMNTVEVVGGLKVNAIMTQAGLLPLIPDPWLPSATGAAYGYSAPPVGETNYFAAIVSESDIERPVIHGEQENYGPRMFKLGLTSNLNDQYVAVKFDAIVAKGPSYAHSIVVVQKVA